MSELQFHPLADLFPLMEGEDFDALVADIAANGLREKIDLYQGKIVEGRNRYLALQRLGIEPSADQKQYFRKAIYAHTVGGEIAPHEQSNDDRVRAYVISKNLHRRHLDAKQKRDVIAKLLKAQPEKSNVTISKVVKADDKTVAKVRRELEATSEIPKLDKTVGADGKARKQPAKKAGGWSRERYKAHRASKRDPSVEVRGEVTESDGSRPKVAAEEISRFAYKLIQLDIGLARELEHILQAGGATRLMFDLDTGIEIEESAPTENAPPPDVSAQVEQPKRKRAWELFAEGMSQQQIADQLGVSQSTVSHYLRGDSGGVGADDDTTAPASNAPPPEVGAEIMKANLAALDDGPAAA